MEPEKKKDEPSQTTDNPPPDVKSEVIPEIESGVSMAGDIEKPWQKRIMVLIWILATAVIIASAQLSLHLSQVSIISIPQAIALFFIPLGCSILMPFLGKFDDIKLSVYCGLTAGILAMVIVLMGLFSPGLYGVLELSDNYYAWVGKQIAISAIAIMPTTIVGSAIGGAIESY